jgi:hypothetical protein
LTLIDANARPGSRTATATRREVGQPRPDGEHEVGLADQVVVRRRALQADPADLPPRLLLTAPLPAMVSSTGMPADPARASSSRWRRSRRHHRRDDDRLARGGEQPGDRLDLVGIGDRRRITQSRSAKNSAGKSKAWLWTSWGSDSTTAPVSTGSVSTRIACGSAVSSCSGRLIRSKNRETGPEGVVDCGVGLDRVLQLLQHRALPAGGVGVAGQHQHGQPVHRRQPGRGDQVECSRADRTR